MDLRIKGDVAVVLGAASGIGLAIADAFAAEGVRVALADINSVVEENAERIAAAHHVETSSLLVDVSDFEEVSKAAEQVADRFNGCHHVVVAAGMGSGKFGYPFWNLHPNDWQRVWEVNVMGTVHAAHAFAPKLIAAGRGTMTFLASVAAQIGSQTDPPYSAAKAAVINFAHCAAKDLAAHNVRVNVISPGMVKTPLNRSVWQAWHDQQPEDQRQSYEDWAASKIRQIAPLARWQTPEDIAAAAVFLASRQAENITGQTINVDGGQVMHS